jgi:hypothetical protein
VVYDRPLVHEEITRADLATGKGGSVFRSAWFLVPALASWSGCSGSSGSNDAGVHSDGNGAVGDAANGVGADASMPFSGLSACDAGGPTISADCDLSISLTGGVSGSFSNFSCGSSIRSISWSDLGGSGVGISITFVAATAPVDQLGTFQLQSLDVTQVSNGETLRWRTPPAACSLSIEGSVCSPTAAFMQRRVIDGTGACSQPAAPQSGNTKAAVTIGDFEFVASLNPM